MKSRQSRKRSLRKRSLRKGGSWYNPFTWVSGSNSPPSKLGLLLPWSNNQPSNQPSNQSSYNQPSNQSSYNQSSYNQPNTNDSSEAGYMESVANQTPANQIGGHRRRTRRYRR